MSEQTPFIGIGRNPEGPDLPLGFGMRLAQEPAAVARYGALTGGQKETVVRYIQSGATGEDALNRIENAVRGLKEGNLAFLGPNG